MSGASFTSGTGAEGLPTHTTHEQAKTELDSVMIWMDDMQKRLKRDILDLDNVRSAMGYLKEIRKKEGQIEQLFGPVEEMCAVPQLLRTTGDGTDVRWGHWRDSLQGLP